MPINTYSTVHTGAKIQLGGLKAGLLIKLYQPVRDEELKNPAKEPKANGKDTATKNFITRFISFLTVDDIDLFKNTASNPAMFFIIGN